MIGRLGIRGALAAYALLLAASAAQPAAAQDFNAPKWNPWVEFGGLGRDGDSRALIELWAPLMQGPTALFFFDGRFQFIEDDAQEGNAQFGLRKMTPSGWNLGAWVSGDVSDTSLDNTFWQVSGGLEALSVKWDLRVNGYLPVTDPQASPSTAEVVLRRNNIFLIGGEEVALYGVDGEIGYLLFGSPETRQGTRHEFRVYGGGFWFDHSDAIDEVAGPSARIEWRIDDLIPNWGGSRFTLDAGWSHDEVRDDVWEVGARLRIPLGGAKTYAQLNPQARRMQERIERDHDIVTAKSGPENVYDSLTGVRFDRVAYVNPSITDVSAAASDNSLLIVNGTVSGPQELRGNQTLQGGQSTILVTGVKTGVTTSFTAPGPRARLVDPEDNPNLTLLGSNTHVAGLNIIGVGGNLGLTNNHGIFGDSNKNNVVIADTAIRDTGGVGIAFIDGNSNVTIVNTSVRNADNHGIFFFSGNRNVSIDGASVTDTTFDGISFFSGNENVTIANSFIADAGQAGIAFFNNNENVTITDTTVTKATVDGIHFSRRNNNVLISGVSITDVEQGIRFGEDNADPDENSNVTIANTTITNAASVGIWFFNDNSNVTISGTSITDTASDGILFFNRNSNVTIAGTTVTDTGNFGIAFDSFNNNVTIANTDITDTASDGINFFNDNTDVTISGTTVTDTGFFGIHFESGNIGVTITGTSVTDTVDDGINFNSDNSNINISNTRVTNALSGITFFINNSNVSISGTTITNSVNGFFFNEDNSVDLDNSTLAGTFGGSGIFIFGTGNTLNGADNTTVNFTGTLCRDNSNFWDGEIEFNGDPPITEADCTD